MRELWRKVRENYSFSFSLCHSFLFLLLLLPFFTSLSSLFPSLLLKRLYSFLFLPLLFLTFLLQSFLLFLFISLSSLLSTSPLPPLLNFPSSIFSSLSLLLSLVLPPFLLLLLLLLIFYSLSSLLPSSLLPTPHLLLLPFAPSFFFSFSSLTLVLHNVLLRLLLFSFNSKSTLLSLPSL